MTGKREARVVLLMGVAATGKTTIGRQLAEALDWALVDGDDLHPEANVEKMSRGEALTDADRWPWLDTIRAYIDAAIEQGRPVVVACSALKQVYRDRLGADRDEVRVVYLHGDRALLERRIAGRRGHFMKPNMLESQLATLEPPTDALAVDVAGSPEEIVQEIVDDLAR